VVEKEEWDQMRLNQRSSAIESKAAFLTSEGAKAQYIAFAKIKANLLTQSVGKISHRENP